MNGHDQIVAILMHAGADASIEDSVLLLLLLAFSLDLSARNALRGVLRI
jgi:hypothetical protein